MSKLLIDTDKIDNDLLSQARNSKSHIQTTRNNAQRVNMPNDDYNWSRVTSQIEDCVDETEKYINWIKEVNRKYKDGIINSTDLINKVNTTELQFDELHT